METFGFYHHEIPSFLEELTETRVMQRLKKIGMDCGCEYTSFPLFRSIDTYSRFAHSLGVGLITWHFTRDTGSAAAALLHDIATPVFAHTVDFLNGDYVFQESTEEKTCAILSASEEIQNILYKYGLSVQDVEDYHRYPIADNHSPKLSADRLEYTLGNSCHYGFADISRLKTIYSDLCVARNEDNEEELAFMSLETAVAFATYSLKCSRVYTSREDRYAMQILSEILSAALSTETITPEDLYRDEPYVITRITGNPLLRDRWTLFRNLSEITEPEKHPESSRIVPAKKRRIDPLVYGEGRLSSLSDRYREDLAAYLKEDFSKPICAI